MGVNRVVSAILSTAIATSCFTLPSQSAGLGGFFPVSPPTIGALTIIRQPSNVVPQVRYVREYDQIWQLVQNHFLYRNRLGNWSRWRHRFDRQLTSPQSMQIAVDTMLGSLNDPYTYYRNEQATSSRNQESVETNVVDYRMLNRKVGYIKLKTFSSKNCVDEMRMGMRQLRGAKAIVMDLRDNHGGSIDDAFRIFSMFVKSGSFTSMVGVEKKKLVKEQLTVSKTNLVDQRKGRRVATVSKQERERNVSKARPLYVLVDGQTRSAAEMLAGALRDSAGAKLIGTRTYGNGVIQRVWEFDDHTSVKITSAAYHLPSGATVHGIGIKPAIKVVSGKSDRQLQLATRLSKVSALSMKNKFGQTSHSKSVIAKSSY